MKSLVEQIRRLYPFRDFEANVREQVERLASSPLVPAGSPVTGFVYEVESARMREVATARTGRAQAVA